jgi:hypothetical protein
MSSSQSTRMNPGILSQSRLLLLHPLAVRKDVAKRELIANKLQKVLDHGYVWLGKVLSLTGYFAMDKAKGEDFHMTPTGPPTCMYL